MEFNKRIPLTEPTFKKLRKLKYNKDFETYDDLINDMIKKFK